MSELNNRPYFGCVGDDFTGASDAASFLAKQGVKTVLCNGIPDSADELADCEAVVIALKTRSIAADDAVKECMEAFELLHGLGAKQLYFKYCSTFDSTPKGNIGPVADAVLERFGIPYTLLCPSLPVNGRTVRGGLLYVLGVPLHESPMRNHPLNPMWSADIGELMRPQSKYPCHVPDKGLLDRAADEVLAAVQEYAGREGHFYLVPDYEDDAQGRRIARLFGGLPFLTGGSGLLEFLAELYLEGAAGRPSNQSLPGVAGKAVLLCGSCSAATKEQIRTFKDSGGKYCAVNPARLLSGEQSEREIWSFVRSCGDEPVLVYSTGADDAARIHDNEEDREAEAALLESVMAGLGRRAREDGYTRIIAAGGETSGAVTRELGFRSFQIGESVAPGVPVMAPVNRQDMRIVLKSGNFGQPDFFRRALQMTGG